jgi:hypothetical protein
MCGACPAGPVLSARRYLETLVLGIYAQIIWLRTGVSVGSLSQNVARKWLASSVASALIGGDAISPNLDRGVRLHEVAIPRSVIATTHLALFCQR